MICVSRGVEEHAAWTNSMQWWKLLCNNTQSQLIDRWILLVKKWGEQIRIALRDQMACQWWFSFQVIKLTIFELCAVVISVHRPTKTFTSIKHYVIFQVVPGHLKLQWSADKSVCPWGPSHCKINADFIMQGRRKAPVFNTDSLYLLD